MATKITLEQLLKILEPQIKWLSRSVRIKGYDDKDIAQELVLKVTEDVRSGKGQRKGVSWWFLRLKWHAIYIYRRELREPLTKSITLETILEKSDEYKNRGRCGKQIYIIEGGF
jgi:DNA-directed RNA polymerase specialized sigma24 family protein